MKDLKAGSATKEDLKLAKTIIDKMEAVAIIIGCSISNSSAEFIIEKIKKGQAVIAITENNILLGFFNNTVLENGEIAPAYKVYHISRHGK